MLLNLIVIAPTHADTVLIEAGAELFTQAPTTSPNNISALDRNPDPPGGAFVPGMNPTVSINDTFLPAAGGQFDASATATASLSSGPILKVLATFGITAGPPNGFQY